MPVRDVREESGERIGADLPLQHMLRGSGAPDRGRRHAGSRNRVSTVLVPSSRESPHARAPAPSRWRTSRRCRSRAPGSRRRTSRRTPCTARRASARDPAPGRSRRPISPLNAGRSLRIDRRPHARSHAVGADDTSPRSVRPSAKCAVIPSTRCSIEVSSQPYQRSTPAPAAPSLRTLVQPAPADDHAAVGGPAGRPVRHRAEPSTPVTPHHHLRCRMGGREQTILESERAQHPSSVDRDVEEQALVREGRRSSLQNRGLPAACGQQGGGGGARHAPPTTSAFGMRTSW